MSAHIFGFTSDYLRQSGFRMNACLNLGLDLALFGMHLAAATKNLSLCNASSLYLMAQLGTTH